MAVDGIADGRLWAKALEVAVGGVGEPDRAVACHYHVVGGVERKPPPVLDDGLAVARATVEAADAGGLPAASLFADDQPPVVVRSHAVGTVGLRDENRHVVGVLERKALDLDLRGAVRSWPRKRGEVERVLIGEVDGALVGVDLGDQRQPRSIAHHLVEVRRVGHECRLLCGDHDTRPRALSISHAAVIRPMWLNACGKLPSSSPVAVSISSASSPRSLA